MTAPTRAALLELATRCEQASGPDRELDADILAAVRGMATLWPGYYEMGGWYYSDNGDEKNPPYPSPTASLDAALSLMPDGTWWSVGRDTADDSPLRGFGWRGRSCFFGETGFWKSGIIAHRPGATPALALCSAALRALAAEAGHE